MTFVVLAAWSSGKSVTLALSGGRCQPDIRQDDEFRIQNLTNLQSSSRSSPLFLIFFFIFFSSTLPSYHPLHTLEYRKRSFRVLQKNCFHCKAVSYRYRSVGSLFVGRTDYLSIWFDVVCVLKSPSKKYDTFTQ